MSLGGAPVIRTSKLIFQPISAGIGFKSNGQITVGGFVLEEGNGVDLQPDVPSGTITISSKRSVVEHTTSETFSDDDLYPTTVHHGTGSITLTIPPTVIPGSTLVFTKTSPMGTVNITGSAGPSDKFFISGLGTGTTLSGTGVGAYLNIITYDGVSWYGTATGWTIS